MISTKVLRSGRILGRFRKMLPLLFFVVLVAALFCTTPFSLWRSGVVLTTVSLLVALCGFAVRWSASKCDSRNLKRRLSTFSPSVPSSSGKCPAAESCPSASSSCGCGGCCGHRH